jgi:hypothetical protein
VPELGLLGSVRGALSNERPYRECGKSGLSTIAAGEARISSNFCHLSSTLALELA